MGKVGYPSVANHANTFPGGAEGVVANANNGWGNAVGGQSVITDSNPTPTDYFILLESGDYILQQTSSKILTEAS